MQPTTTGRQAPRPGVLDMFAVTGVSVDPRIPLLETPFGRFETYFEGGGRSTGDDLPDESLRISGGVSLHRFDRGAWVAELLIGPVKPSLPPGMAVSGCLAAIWRVRAVERTAGCRFVCDRPDPTPEADGSPETGEGLDALTWRTPGHTLSLGTEDGEFLSARAEKNDLVPARLSGELSISTVEYSGSGLIVPFSGLEPSEVLQVQFIVAWEHESAEGSYASWFAVEQSPSYLLRQLAGVAAVDA